MNRTKTLDYKASFHILNKISSGGSESGWESARKGSSIRASDKGMIILNKPARFNLSDVMGHFETDPQGNMVIVKKATTQNGLTPRSEILVDALNRKVNKRGYLIDDQGNVVSKFGEIVVNR